MKMKRRKKEESASINKDFCENIARDLKEMKGETLSSRARFWKIPRSTLRMAMLKYCLIPENGRKTAHKKEEILDYFEIHGGHKASVVYDVPTATLYTWRRQRRAEKKTKTIKRRRKR